MTTADLELDPKVAKRSVTRSDTEMLSGMSGPGGPVLFFGLGGSGVEQQGMLPLEAPMYGSRECDALLRSTVIRESMWSSVVFKVTTRIASFGWNISDAKYSERRIINAQNLLHMTELGGGWVQFISRVVKDFLCTNNGAFIEVVRATKAAGSRVIGLKHLDSLRCWRTGDPERPVVYYDLMGRYHVLRDYQVIEMVDMPSSDPALRGIGLCAAMRAYRSIVKMQYLQNYIVEKIAGRRPQALYFVNGVRDTQIQDAINGAQASASAEGYITWMSAVIIPTYRQEAPEVATIELYGLPDKADPDAERRDCYLHYAHASGVFVGEIQPLEGQFGTGMQSVVLSEAAQGQGMAALTSQLEHKISRQALPAPTSFALINTNDLRDQKSRADIKKVRAETRKIQKENGELNDDTIKQQAADDGDLNRLFLEQDATPDDSINDDEKPAELTESSPDEAAKMASKPSEAEGGAKGESEGKVGRDAGQKVRETAKQLDALADELMVRALKGQAFTEDELKHLLPSAQVITKQVGDRIMRARRDVARSYKNAEELYHSIRTPHA